MFDAAWLDRFTLHAFGQGKVFKAEDWNATRKAAGLAALTASGESFAPAYDVQKASGLLTLSNAAVKAGARVRELDVKPFAAAVAMGPAKTYQKTDIAT